ncbi:hypothetical protein G6514_005558 [Epicoccum nigrum]|nr:hypothetical protein G6514_005558 [Epicoccum nigrum]
MAPNIPDTYLWLGLGAFTVLLVTHVSTSLRHVKHLTAVSTPPPPRPGHGHPPSPSAQEDAIKTTSLLTLATSPNTDIRHAATQLLCERFAAHRPAWKKLARHLASRDGEKARRARLAARLLTRYRVLGHYRVSPVGGWEGWGMSWEEAAGVREPLREIIAGEHEDEEERDARRRRREAVVIHEGEGRVGRADVWMRDREGVLGLDFEAEGDRLVRELEAAELVIDGVVH